MRHGSLQLKFQSDGDGTGKLLASVEARGFAGRGGAWFDISQIDKFADAIAAFPLPTDRRCLLNSGFWKNGGLDQEHLAIEIYPVDTRGHIGVQVRLASELWGNDRQQSQSAVRVEMYTTYERLRKFSNDLRALVHDASEEILLEGESWTEHTKEN
jgi:hypothetical protein